MQTLPPTFVVADRYELGAVVGRGGYGMVCRAHDRKTGRTVAVKVLSPAAGRDPHLIERMLREQQAMVALEGTCAVTAVDLCRMASGAPCLVMEWLEGRDLERQLDDWEAKHEHPSRQRLLAILQPLTETLHRAHEIGIVHRDLKPANIFLMADSSGARLGDVTPATAAEAIAEPGVRLLDFGLARMQSAAPMTAVGVVMGSPSYIAPEGWRGNSALIDHRADLYALAVIVFRMLTGQLPFEAKSLLAKLNLATTAPRPSVVALRPDLAPTIDEWMKRALAIDPAARFQTARELYVSLILALDGVPALAPLADVPTPPERKSIMATAWDAAKSLLRRFTAQPGSDRAPDLPSSPWTTVPEVSAPPSAVAPSAVAPSALAPSAVANGQRPLASAMTPTESPSESPRELTPPTKAPERSLWLDQSDLEEVTLEYRPRTPAATAGAAPTKGAAEAKTKAKRKTGAKAKPRGKAKPKAKPSPRPKPKTTGKSQSKVTSAAAVAGGRETKVAKTSKRRR